MTVLKNDLPSVKIAQVMRRQMSAVKESRMTWTSCKSKCGDSLARVKIEAHNVLDGVLREEQSLVYVQSLLFAPLLHACVDVVAVGGQFLGLLESVSYGGYVRRRDNPAIPFQSGDVVFGI